MQNNIQELINKDVTEYMRGYEVRNEYLEERVHTTQLFDGISVICNYGAAQLIEESIKAHINEVEEDIAVSFRVFNQLCEMQEFLFKNRDEIECIAKESLIENFSLKNLESDSRTINILPDFNMNILYNGEGIESLEYLKKLAWLRIESLLPKRNELNVLLNKLNDASDGDDYLTSEYEISKEIMKNYNKIDGDRLDNLFYNKTLIDNKEEILVEVKMCLHNQLSKINDYRNNFSLYIIKYFPWECYLNYCYIREAYLQIKSEEL